MTLNEQQLSDRLHRLVPEPPRLVTTEDVAARVVSRATGGRRAPSGRLRGWLAVLAVACVVAAIASAVAVWNSRSGTRPEPTQPPARQTTSGAPTSPSPPKRTNGAGQGIGPWHGVLLSDPGALQGSLLGSGDSLYANTGQAIVRINPATGGVVAHVAYPSGWGQPLIGAQRMWLASEMDRQGTVRLDWFDLTRLRRLGSIAVSFPAIAAGQGSGTVLAANPNVRELYVGAGDNIAVIDTTSSHVLRRIPVTDGAVTALAISPDGARLYVGVTLANDSGELQVRDISTGALLSTRPTGALLSWYGYGLAITERGVWTVTASGMQDTVSFADTNNPNAPLSVADGGGGYIPTITIAHGTAWVGTTDQIICADPNTRHVRARGAVQERGGSAELDSAVYLDGRLYALYLDGSGRQGLVRLTPPPACS
jgi:DNA-binding beta-propeller fold protein YncE